MALEYQTWLSRMANSIDDKSVFKKETGVTSFQVRAAIADLLVPNQSTAALVDDWVSVFCVDLTGDTWGERSLLSVLFAGLVGREISHGYYESTDDAESTLWLKSFKASL